MRFILRIHFDLGLGSFGGVPDPSVPTSGFHAPVSSSSFGVPPHHMPGPLLILW